MKMNFDKKAWYRATDIDEYSDKLITVMTDMENDRAGSFKELDRILDIIILDAKQLKDELLK